MSSTEAPLSVACFISPHGYGHAARAAAVMAAFQERRPGTVFHIFTRLPTHFFEISLSGPFVYHDWLTDVGMVQKNALEEDLPASVARLDAFMPYDETVVTELAGLLKENGCRFAICDIAPLGIAAARAAGIPSVLVENFTWDWIYEGYAKLDPAMGRHIAYLREMFCSADYHVQAEPVCRRERPHFTSPPASRHPRLTREALRAQVGIEPDRPVIMITMGGTEERYAFLERLMTAQDITFIIPGGVQEEERRDNLVLLPHHSDFYHPDLVNAADAVIGKVGYSTLSEVYHAGVPYGYVTRAHFREIEGLSAYVREHMHGLHIRPEEFRDTSWLARLPELLALPRVQRNTPNGAMEIARFLDRTVLNETG